MQNNARHWRLVCGLIVGVTEEIKTPAVARVLGGQATYLPSTLTR